MPPPTNPERKSPIRLPIIATAAPIPPASSSRLNEIGPIPRSSRVVMFVRCHAVILIAPCKKVAALSGLPRSPDGNTPTLTSEQQCYPTAARGHHQHQPDDHVAEGFRIALLPFTHDWNGGEQVHRAYPQKADHREAATDGK